MRFNDERRSNARDAPVYTWTLQLTGSEAELLWDDINAKWRTTQRCTIKSYINLVFSDFRPVDASDCSCGTWLHVERNANREASGRNKAHVKSLGTRENSTIFRMIDNDLHIRVRPASEWRFWKLNANIRGVQRTKRHDEFVLLRAQSSIESRTQSPNTLLHARELK